MSSALLIILLAFLLVISNLQISDGQSGKWCIADEQITLDWACGKGGEDCRKIQVNQPCYFPNTIKDHAPFAFNDYYQKFKSQGATCYLHSAAMITDLNLSHHSCKFEYRP